MAPTESATTTATMANGEKPQSEFLSHLSSYPVVSDTINAYKSNPYGAKTLDLAAQAQNQYISPVLSSKQAQQAQSYIHPYAAKADSLGSEGLKKVENHFPLITKDTATIRQTLVSLIFMPITLPLSYARWGYGWVSETYANEVDNAGHGQGGVMAYGAAVVTTGLTAVGDSTNWAKSWIVKAEQEGEAKYGQVRESVGNRMQQGEAVYGELKDSVGKRVQEGEAKLGEFRDNVNKRTQDAKKDAKKEVNKDANGKV